MSLFTSILQNLQKKITDEQSYKDIGISTIYTLCGVTLTPDTLELKKGTLTITTHPTIKMAILLKKEGIITELQKQGVGVSTIK